MISEAELRRTAARWRVDPMVIDLDYGLGWFLAALSTTNATNRLRFKGGTCLRKCYFSDYRFSEDLDFTATTHVGPNDLIRWVTDAARWSIGRDGPDFAAAPARLEVVEDEYGSESYQVRVYFRGPLRWGGTPRAIRVDVTRKEEISLPANTRGLFHPYSDQGQLGAVSVPCYALEEILAEKMRAVSGQRRFAVSRDLYDIHHLLVAGVQIADVVPLLPKKYVARGLALDALSSDNLLARRDAFEADWQRRLSYLIPGSVVDFTTAWHSTVSAIDTAQIALGAS